MIYSNANTNHMLRRKSNIHKPKSVQENETHKILLDFGIQTDQTIPARRPDLDLINEKKELFHLSNVSFQ